MSASIPPPRQRLTVPEFGIRDVPLTLSLWLVPKGAHVVAGDRVAELAAGGVTIDLEAPVTGRLMRVLVDEDDAVAPGTVLAEFVPSPDHD
jgi:pyruvate/2-oxoglutarate dehydrogenase complex dihydrolipoamide acyltransferase (E2) component